MESLKIVLYSHTNHRIFQLERHTEESLSPTPKYWFATACVLPDPSAIPITNSFSPARRWLFKIWPVADTAKLNLLEGSLEGQNWICSWEALSLVIYKRRWGKSQIQNPTFSDSHVKWVYRNVLNVLWHKTWRSQPKSQNENKVWYIKSPS